MSNVGYATLQIIPSAKGFQSALTKETAVPMAASGKAGGQAFGGGLLTMAKGFAGPIAAAFAGQAVFNFLKDSVSGASDLNETVSKTKVVFGDAADEVLNYAKTANTSLGQTQQSALDGASTFGVFGKAAGLTGKDLAGFSTGLTGLSGDLASFYNTSPEDAITAIGAALRGESEPIRQYGVLLDDASLRQQALAMGLIATTKTALTPQQRVLAAQALIMKQTAVAQGDFARTSGGLANQQRILSAQFSDLKTKLGAALLPVVTSAITLFNKWLPSLQSAAGALGGILGPALKTAGAVLSGFVAAISGSQGTTVGVFGVIGGATRTLRDVFGQLASFVTGGLLPSVVSLVKYIGSSLAPIFQSVWSILQGQVLPIIASLASFFVGTLLPAILGIYQAIAQRLKPVFDTLVATYRKNVLPALEQVLAKFREWQPTIQRVISVVVQVTGFVLKLAAAILGKVLPPLIKFAGFLLVNVVGAIVTVIGWVVKIIGKVIDFGSTVVGAVGKVGQFVSGLKAKFGEAVSFVGGVPGKVKKSLGNLGSLLLSAGKDIIRGLIAGMGDMIGAVEDKVSGIVDGIKSKITGALKIHSPSRVMMGYGQNISEGLAIGIQQAAPKVNKAAAALTAFSETSTGGLSIADAKRAGGFLGGDTYVFNGRNLDINEQTIAPVIHGARVRTRVGRPR
ncbi:phage tail protein [Actinopolymorpha pittospori]|uniref:Phage-related protein n=1 Tax=Actinopolymorpha pittospori TaxID=648752 RepID=A0A927RK14_9ACTN|nr:hypothetical protein [Actinopolymorpha pittospori]MBE1606243.1 phage-related protein [Actinopolymorpha pittospori]